LKATTYNSCIENSSTSRVYGVERIVILALIKCICKKREKVHAKSVYYKSTKYPDEKRIVTKDEAFTM